MLQCLRVTCHANLATGALISSRRGYSGFVDAPCRDLTAILDSHHDRRGPPPVSLLMYRHQSPRDSLSAIPSSLVHCRRGCLSSSYVVVLRHASSAGSCEPMAFTRELKGALRVKFCCKWLGRLLTHGPFPRMLTVSPGHAASSEQVSPGHSHPSHEICFETRGWAEGL